MADAHQGWAPLATFALLLAGIYAAVGVVLSRLALIDDPTWIALGLTADLTLLVPALYYLTMVRWRGWPVLTVVPVFVCSVLLAEQLIPDSHHFALDWLGPVAILAELTVLTLVGVQVYRLRSAYQLQRRSDGEVYDSLRMSARTVLGSTVGALLAYEIALLYYAVFGWRRHLERRPAGFTMHRKNGYLGVVGAIFMIGFVELFAVHLLVQLWSVTAAWILTMLSVYGILWIVGDTNAIRLRRTRIREEMLRICVGLRWSARVPLTQIEQVVQVSEKAKEKTEDYVCAALIGQPNVRLEFNQGVELAGPYGLSRRVRTLDLQLDDAAAFISAISSKSDQFDEEAKSRLCERERLPQGEG